MGPGKGTRNSFHTVYFGPGLLVKAVLPRYFSFVAFAAADWHRL